MPQTTFMATGAGVKSSVLFLRKQKVKQTEKISDQKARLKERIKKESKYITTIEKWEKDKRGNIGRLPDFYGHRRRYWL